MSETRFNSELAKRVVAAVREAMAHSEEIDPGYTRHAPNLPDVIKQGDRCEINEDELDQFRTVVDLLICSIFGLDCDGDRYVKFRLVNRKTEDTILPSFHVPRLSLGEKDENKYWLQLQAIHANLSSWQTAFDQAMRVFQITKTMNAKKGNTHNE